MTAPPVQRPSASPRSLRCAHLAAVLDHLATDGPQSRARIADALGISRTSMTAIAAQLLAAGAVVERGRSSPGERGGRPGELLMLHPHAAVAVGVHDDGGVVRLVARFLDGRTVIRNPAAQASALGPWPTLLTTWHAVAPAPVCVDSAQLAGGPTELAALAESESAGVSAGFIALDDGVRIGAAINGVAMPSSRAASPHRPAHASIREGRPVPAEDLEVLRCDLVGAVEAILTCIRVELIALDALLAPLGDGFLASILKRARADVPVRYAANGPAAPATGAALIGARQLSSHLAGSIAARS